MSIASAFIYGMIFAVMAGNLIYCIVDMRRMRQESKKLDMMGEDILKDIEVGKQYIEIAKELTERIDKIEEKLKEE